jgi:geranylgeranyl diphosphate synthase, type I
MNNLDERDAIQEAMRQAFPAAEERLARFYAMMEYHLGWRDEHLQPARSDPGKLLRPRLALLACQAAGAEPARALPLAAGIQLIHDFSLVHDDIEDDSATRRARPTVWKLWGMPQGINTGDGMFVIAHLAIHRLAENGTPPALTLEVLRRFSATILTICEGQFLDLSYEGNLAIDEDAYLAMIRRKTAVLIGAAAELGALVGGADDTTARALAEFGVNLGLAFQVQDDVLGVWGDPEVTGKPFAADLIQRKLSLPVIHALRAEGGQGALAAIYARRETREGDVPAMLDALEQAGARTYTEATAGRFHTQSLAALDRAEGDARTLAQLRVIAEGLLGRKN